MPIPPFCRVFCSKNCSYVAGSVKISLLIFAKIRSLIADKPSILLAEATEELTFLEIIELNPKNRVFLA
jgi:hypothetical protein